jgi:hypothetical protein
MEQFYSYVLSFYGKNGIYDMGATLDEVMEATAKYLKESSIPFDGDSIDRENVRDIMMNDYGLEFTVPEIKVAHQTPIVA